MKTAKYTNKDTLKYRLKQINIPNELSDESFKYLNQINFSEKELAEWQFCFGDFRKKDLSKITTLQNKCFDTETQFSIEQQLRLEPEKLIELGKRRGLGIDKLKELGFNGNGIRIAIIDGFFSLEHKEFDNSNILFDDSNIQDYIINIDEQNILLPAKEMKKSQNFHGLTVASLLCGKNIGIAPNSTCHYFACNDITEKFQSDRISALEKIIKYNDENPEDKIQIISMSSGLTNGKLGEDKEIDLLRDKYHNRLKEQGCILLDINESMMQRYTQGCIKDIYGNIDDIENYFLSFASDDSTIFTEYQKYLRNTEKNVESTNTLTLEEFKKDYINKINTTYKEKLIIPSGKITIPEVETKSGYRYEGNATSLSWTVPIIAGYMAMCKQIDKDLTEDDIYNYFRTSQSITENGLKIINLPQSLLQIARNKLKQEPNNEEVNKYLKLLETNFPEIKQSFSKELKTLTVPEDELHIPSDTQTEISNNISKENELIC